MNNIVSQLMVQVQAPVILVVGEWIARHPGTISLGQGIVHYPPPPAVAAGVADAVGSDVRVDRYGWYADWTSCWLWAIGERPGPTVAWG